MLQVVVIVCKQLLQPFTKLFKYFVTSCYNVYKSVEQCCIIVVSYLYIQLSIGTILEYLCTCYYLYLYIIVCYTISKLVKCAIAHFTNTDTMWPGGIKISIPTQNFGSGMSKIMISDTQRPKYQVSEPCTRQWWHLESRIFKTTVQNWMTRW